MTGRRGSGVRAAVAGLTVLLAPLALAAGGLVAWHDRRMTRASVLLTTSLVLAHALVVWPGVRHAVRRIVGQVGQVVGRTLTTVLLLPCFAVAAAVGTSVDRLGRLVGRPQVQGWEDVAVSGGAPPGRPFIRESAPRSSDQAWAVRRAVLRTVAVLVVLECAAAAIVYQQTRPPRTTYGGVSTPGAASSAAAQGLPWANEATKEGGEVAARVVFTPYLGDSVRNYSGRYFNVQDRVRRSYQAPPGKVKPLDVWFFGSSTMFGLDLQRDDHTIPSDVVRLAQHDGIAIRAFNYGAPGYVNYAEAVLLQLLLGQGRRPDLVVFYDGINDESAQAFNVVLGADPPAEPTYVTAEFTRRVLAASAGGLPGANNAPPSPLVPSRVRTRPLTVASLVDATTSVYRQGIDLVRILGRAYAFSSAFYWQPTVYSRRVPVPGEMARLRQLHSDSFRYATVRALDQRIRAQLPAGVVDLGDALDDVRGPVYTDQAHTNERGALAVAEDMYAHLRPQLRALAAERNRRR